VVGEELVMAMKKVMERKVAQYSYEIFKGLKVVTVSIV